MSDFWTDDKVAALRIGVENSLSASAIGVLLQCSRNAVIGKCRRLGLTLTGRELGGCTDLVPETVASAVEVAAGYEPPKPRAPRAPKPVPTPFDVLPEIVHEEPMGDLPGVAFADLNSTHCRALIGDLYCGAPIAHPKLSYCAEHAKAYLTTPARMRAAQREETDGRANLGRWA